MLKYVKQIIKSILGFISYYTVSICKVLFSDKAFLSSFTYKIYRYIPDYSVKKYIELKGSVEKKTIGYIKERNIIHIGFIVYSGAMWFFDELYSLLKENKKYEVNIIIGHYEMREYEASEHEHKKTCDYFRKKGFELSNYNSLEEFDVLFYLTPYSFFEKHLNLENVCINKLIYHVSYSYMLSGNSQKLLFNMYHWSYRYYTDSEFYLNEIQKVNKYCGNARYFGFPKMDQYYLASSKRVSPKTTIIYAPHQSVDYKKYKAATFDINYMFILQMMKEYKDSVHWIYKPHPLLRDRCISGGVFDTYEEYDRFLDEMKETGCVSFANEGDYFDLFKASDAMITDSVSFLAEYQFTGKPLLLLMSGMAEYNSFGNSIVNILYKCNGDDFMGIQSFIRDIINGKDEMKEERILYFRQNLDYMDRFNESANLRIYQDIVETFR